MLNLRKIKIYQQEGNYISAYSENATEFKDLNCLLQALKDMGFNDVEVSEQGTNLYGYHGDKRADLANVIIRRKHIGLASNDIGFRKQANGTYSAILSDYDRSIGYNDKWLGQVKGKYAERGIMQQAKNKGLRFGGRKMVNGKVQLQFVQA